jgi:glycosyltransferase involved in cell wall biosynthesis
MAAPLKRVFGRPVCCTMQGEELFLDSLIQPYRDQALALIRQQAQTVDRLIAVSEYCAGYMGKLLEVPASHVSVVPLGITMDGYGRGDARVARTDDVFTIGYFARVAPEKGLHVLADAYARFRKRTFGAKVRLEAAGYLAPGSQSYLDDVTRVLERGGVAQEFTYRGAVDRDGKLAFLRGLDVLSVPATYDEPKGMFVLEAMASGVPVVQPRRGGFSEIVERTGGGILVDADDPGKLSDGLYTLWSDSSLRADLAERAFHGVRAHYTVAKSADRLTDVYESVIACSKPHTSASSTPLRAAR